MDRSPVLCQKQRPGASDENGGRNWTLTSPEFLNLPRILKFRGPNNQSPYPVHSLAIFPEFLEAWKGRARLPGDVPAKGMKAGLPAPLFRMLPSAIFLIFAFWPAFD
jgi:hypothetical protein